jgi:hypothetical protein
LSTSPKQKRSRFCEQSDAAQRLAGLLREQRKSFPGFASRIDQFIAQVESDSKRSRGRDREKVLELLKAWNLGLTVKELMDDTGYSHWDIRIILSELLRRRQVVKRDELRRGVHSRQWVTVYQAA